MATFCLREATGATLLTRDTGLVVLATVADFMVKDIL